MYDASHDPDWIRLWCVHDDLSFESVSESIIQHSTAGCDRDSQTHTKITDLSRYRGTRSSNPFSGNKPSLFISLVIGLEQ